LIQLTKVIHSVLTNKETCRSISFSG